MNVDITDNTQAQNRQFVVLWALQNYDDILTHFRQRWRHHNLTTWWQYLGYTLIKAYYNYNLYHDQHLFNNIRIIGPSTTTIFP